MLNNTYYHVPSIHPLQVFGAEFFRLLQDHYQNAGHRSTTFLISWWWLFAIYIGVEITFAVVMYFLVLPSMHEMRKPDPCHTDVVRMMKRNIDQIQLLDSYTFEMYIQGFFNQSKLKDVGKENFRSFLSWGMFHKHLEDLTDSEVDKIKEVFNYAAHLHPELLKMRPGRKKTTTHCSMTLEPVPIIHRPLLFYAILHMAEAVSNFLLLNAGGFEQYEMDGITYWFKRHRNHKPDLKDPMLFLHGIAPGWLVYMPIVRALGENRTLILVDLEAIKIKSLNFNMPTPEQFVDRVSRILDRHNIAQVSVAGHSFGSITAGWIVRKCPERVSHLTLIDPVSLLLGLPDVGYSFLYRQPTSWMEGSFTSAPPERSPCPTPCAGTFTGTTTFCGWKTSQPELALWWACLDTTRSRARRRCTSTP